MNLDFINVLLGIAASVISIYSICKSKQSEEKVEKLIEILNDAGIDVNINSGKNSKQIIAKDGSVGIMGKKNQVNLNRGSEDEK
ncbi:MULTISPECIES: hypothetical protein [Enterococcus]|uniref:hypothetical protein n=1 Tax=Enterococcus TaxID=1350 RepID=UPI0003528A5B|nr:hypothetical protein [Enterococcus faecalis]EPH74753.1 hypothetical protein D929_01095 [Enterococcus faecalis 02-MB-P-10]WBY27544.1 hypothetical protein PE069_05715 [Enterococcus faecalis]WHT29900.1 hypothetical protein OGM83_03605 [Enterococcus faecalis]VFU86421.1 hypothetical protein B02_01391 [Enterococcus faecalis]VFU87269.1 hypothetical protein B01_01409 [Enterococcus faecalis]